MRSANDIPGYPNLKTASTAVDWKNVSPSVLKRLDAMAKSKGKTVVIFSGYRSDDYSAAHGGFKGDPHTQHIAVDALVDGRPIGETFTPDDFKKFRLRTGNQANFYHGQTDPSHVDLVGYGGIAGTNSGAPSAPPPPAEAPLTGGAPEPSTIPDAYTEPPPVGSGVPQPQAFDPGTVPADGVNPRVFAETWQRIAADPWAPAETQNYLQDWLTAAGG